MREVGKNKHAQFWTEALEAKYEGKDHALDRQEFDKILAEYQASSLMVYLCVKMPKTYLQSRASRISQLPFSPKI